MSVIWSTMGDIILYTAQLIDDDGIIIKIQALFPEPKNAHMHMQIATAKVNSINKDAYDTSGGEGAVIVNSQLHSLKGLRCSLSWSMDSGLIINWCKSFSPWEVIFPYKEAPSSSSSD